MTGSATGEITRWRNLRDTIGTGERIAWSDLFATCARVRPFLGDDEHPGWSAAVFRDHKRAREHVQRVTAAVLDYDDTTTLERAVEAWGAFFGMVHTSKRHTPERHRLRVILPFSRPVSVFEWDAIWPRLNYHHEGVDPKAKDASRFWYEPGIVDGATFTTARLTGELLDPDDILQAWPVPPSPVPLAAQHTTTGTTEALRDSEGRAIKYIATMPPAIAGQGGHAATWNVARKLAADFRLDESATLRIMREHYNPRCVPPWSERELAHKASEAHGKARVANPITDRERGQPMREPGDESDESESTKPATRIGELLRPALDALMARAKGDEKPIATPWPTVNDALCGGIWPGLYSLVSGTGLGKTQWAMQVALAAAQAGQTVVYVALELGELDAVARVLGLLSGKRWADVYHGKPDAKASGDENAAALARLFGEHEPTLRDLPLFVEVANPYGWKPERLDELVAAHKPALVVVDFLQLISDEKLDQRQAIGRAAYKARAIARDKRIAVLLLSSTARENYSKVQGGEDGKAARSKLGEGSPTRLVGLAKESGEVESACDGVLVLALEDYDPNASARPTWLAVAKQRAGKPAWVKLSFNGSRFDEDESSGSTDGTWKI